MIPHHRRPRLLVAALGAILVALAGMLVLDVRTSQSQPRRLDVPYVPTPEHIVEAMLRLAAPTPDDYLVDLGCGDGRIPIAAAQRFGTRGLCVDLNPERIKEARANAAKAGVSDKVEFIEGDLFKTDFRKATVLTLYLLPIVNMRLRPQILEMRPGTRIVSHAFHMEDWTSDASEQHDFRTVYHWIVPAKVAGKWSGIAAGNPIDLDLDQSFQMLSGSASIDGRTAPIFTGKVRGEEISLTVNLPDGTTRQLAGRVSGATIAGKDLRLTRR